MYKRQFLDRLGADVARQAPAVLPVLDRLRRAAADAGHTVGAVLAPHGPAPVSYTHLIGQSQTFFFQIEAEKPSRVRLEYAVDYAKANGRRSRKVFQISELSLKQGDRRLYAKTHAFADVSVRRHYPGVHAVTLIVNGVERGTLSFEVLASR